MSTPPVFEGSDGRFVATQLARGPWDPNALHGLACPVHRRRGNARPFVEQLAGSSPEYVQILRSQESTDQYEAA